MLSLQERETIIVFNESREAATIFTYNKKWQDRLEKGLKLKPFMNNGKGGKEYYIEKKRIPLPRVPRKLSPETLKRLRDVNTNAILNRKAPIITVKSQHKKKK